MATPTTAHYFTYADYCRKNGIKPFDEKQSLKALMEKIALKKGKPVDPRLLRDESFANTASAILPGAAAGDLGDMSGDMGGETLDTTTHSFFFDPKAPLDLNLQVLNAFRNQPEWLIAHHLDSYNHFVKHVMPNYLSQNELVVDGSANGMGVWVIKFTKPYFVKPQLQKMDECLPLYPTDACNRGLNYAAQFFCDVVTSYQKSPGAEPDISIVESHYMGDIPVLVGSCLCNTYNHPDRFALGEDLLIRGGYFVINGREKVIIGQEKLAPNRIYIFNSGTHLSADVRSVPFNSFKSQSMTSVIFKNGLFYVRMPGFFTADIPLFLFLRTMGLEDVHSCTSIVGVNFTDREDTETVDEATDLLMHQIENIIIPSLEDVAEVATRDAAVEYVCSRIKVDTEKRSVNKAAQLMYIMNEMILPHIGMDRSSYIEKAHTICLMVRRLCFVALGFREKDDRDSFANKRAEITGSLLFGRVKLAFTAVQNKIRKVLQQAIKEKDRRKFKVVDHFTHGDFSKKIQTAFDTGNWSDKATDNFANVCQQLERWSMVATLSAMRQVHVPSSNAGRLESQRNLHPSQWGLMDPADTPEGKQAGLHKKMALTCHFTLGNDPLLVIATINELPYFVPIHTAYEDQDDSADDTGATTAARANAAGADGVRNIWGLYFDLRYYVKVFVNYRLVGFVARETSIDEYETPQPTAQVFMNELKACKRDGRFPFDATIFYQLYDSEIHVLVDTGRMTRPLLLVEDNKLKLTGEKMALIVQQYPAPEVFSQLVRQGFVEYVDPNESEHILVARTLDDLASPPKMEKILGDQTYHLTATYTHCEIHPAVIFGVAASTVAFADHDQAPRITYQSAMGKQAMGVPLTNFLQRVCDNVLYVLCYPQKPLVQSRMLRFCKTQPSGIQFDDSEELDGAGQQAIVAFICKEAYNKEDACILNRGALDRGFGNSLCYKTHRVECRKSSGETFGNKASKVDYIDSSGLPRVGTHLYNNDVLVGRYKTVAPAKAPAPGAAARAPQKGVTAQPEVVDCSERIKTKEALVVSATAVVEGKHEGLAVRTHTVRYPRLGDKFAAAHAQKGVCGMQYPPEDMPFTPGGITPDVIMNPHAFPSRMTFGHILEMLLGKACAITGKYGNATPFEKVSIDAIGDVLKQHGFHRHGEERLIDGQTGEMMQATIFMGVCNYQRLKHMVIDKYHSRSDGNIEIMTHQPTEGRSRGGGLRTGEMERDCKIVHGMSAFLQERLCTLSDATPVKICPNCKSAFTNVKVDELDRQSVYEAKEAAEAQGREPDFTGIKTRVYELCRVCKSGVETVVMPYAFKLVAQEVMALGISMRFDTTESQKQQE